jgi:16S rRNA (adenine1518-N6/adenine1519-N6)-dimethyltransferase
MKDISKKSNTMYLLDKYNMQASKKFGQNFLIDTNIIKRIVRCANIDKDTFVIEIGPGIGALTEYLSYSALKVRCYEIDERLKNVLNESLEECLNVEVVFQDFLTVDLKQVVSELRKDYKKISIVTNLPYYITTDIIEKILKSGIYIDSFTAMVQKEVADKLTDDQYKSPLSLMIKNSGEIEYCFTVSKNVFSPAPRVDSAIIHIDMNNTCSKEFCDILEYSFKQKRKTIYNNLKNVFNDPKDVLNKCHIDEKKRPEQLDVEDYLLLSKYL